jgi:signal transduction histidine kinase
VIEVQRSAESGGGTLKLSIRPLRRDDAGAALITLEDITQQRIADSARNSFVSQAAHELRTPLTNMRLCLEDALEGGETDPSMIREQFNMLNTETRRLERIVGEMLSVSEIEAGSLQIKHDDVRLDKMFEELQSDFRSQAAAKQQKMTFQLPPKYPVLLGDRDKLMIVMHNLLGNALKYTPTGGSITLAVRTTASQLIVDISDTGMGISPEDQQKLFTKFYRAKNAQSSKVVGTGLGLALAREVARLHGGDVTLQSELDKGSTFTLTLPLTNVGQAAAA